jgi:hypothetical protein
LDGGETELVGADLPLTLSVTMHTASEIANGILMAGGLDIVADRAAADSPIFGAREEPLYVLRSGDPGLEMERVEASCYTSTAYHTATVLRDVPGTRALESAVLLTGGVPSVELRGQEQALATKMVKQTVLVYRRPTDSTYRVRELAAGISTAMGLSTARWGHAATPLPGQRVLITGGFVQFPRDTGVAISTTNAAEILSYGESIPSLDVCGADSIGVADAQPAEPEICSGGRLDAGRPDVREDGATSDGSLEGGFDGGLDRAGDG